MDNIKYFLDNVCKHNNHYRYDRLENLAELYCEDNPVPVALIEWKKDIGMFEVRFRIGLTSIEVASISRDLAIQDMCLVFLEDFMIDQEYGYLYGEDATKVFMMRIQKKLEKANEPKLNDAFFVSSQPILTCGFGNRGKTKLARLLGSSYD